MLPERTMTTEQERHKTLGSPLERDHTHPPEIALSFGALISNKLVCHNLYMLKFVFFAKKLPFGSFSYGSEDLFVATSFLQFMSLYFRCLISQVVFTLKHYTFRRNSSSASSFKPFTSPGIDTIDPSMHNRDSKKSKNIMRIGHNSFAIRYVLLTAET